MKSEAAFYVSHLAVLAVLLIGSSGYHLLQYILLTTWRVGTFAIECCQGRTLGRIGDDKKMPVLPALSLFFVFLKREDDNVLRFDDDNYSLLSWLDLIGISIPVKVLS